MTEDSERTQESDLVALSPRHWVKLEPDYLAFIRRAPRRDFVVRTIVKREVNGMPLMSADVVIASEETREKYPLTARFPLHFKKTYFPGKMHGDPQDEFDRQSLASHLIGIPPPLGWSPMTFRSCLIPGVPYSRLSPFGKDPEDANIRIARELSLATAAGLFPLVSQAFELLEKLHAGGLGHGDTELHNFVVSPSPLEVVPIDFEAAIRREGLTEEQWETRKALDFAPLLKEAVYLLCALGPQPGRLAEAALNAMPKLFKSPERFKREIGDKQVL